MTPDQKLLTTAEVAALYGVCRATVRRWVQLGRIPSVTTPTGHRRFVPSEIESGLAATRGSGTTSEDLAS